MVDADAISNSVQEVSGGNKRTKYGYPARRCSNCKKVPPERLCPTFEDARKFWEGNTACPRCGFSRLNINSRSITSPIGHCASPAQIASTNTPQTVHSVTECHADEDASIAIATPNSSGIHTAHGTASHTHVAIDDDECTPSTPGHTSSVRKVNCKGNITPPVSRKIVKPKRNTSFARTPPTLKKYKTHGTCKKTNLPSDNQKSTIRRLQKCVSQHKVKLARVKAELGFLGLDSDEEEVFFLSEFPKPNFELKRVSRTLVRLVASR